MARPRSQIVQPERTRHHRVARCVRRAWLRGEDGYTGKNFDHRKSWLLARMKTLEDYLELVDWTGRLARPEKKGAIAPDAPAALEELGLNAVRWRVLTLEIQKRAIVMFHGLESVRAWERRRVKKAA